MPKETAIRTESANAIELRKVKKTRIVEPIVGKTAKQDAITIKPAKTEAPRTAEIKPVKPRIDVTKPVEIKLVKPRIDEIRPGETLGVRPRREGDSRLRLAGTKYVVNRRFKIVGTANVGLSRYEAEIRQSGIEIQEVNGELINSDDGIRIRQIGPETIDGMLEIERTASRTREETPGIGNSEDLLEFKQKGETLDYDNRIGIEGIMTS